MALTVYQAIQLRRSEMFSKAGIQRPNITLLRSLNMFFNCAVYKHFVPNGTKTRQHTLPLRHSRRCSVGQLMNLLT